MTYGVLCKPETARKEMTMRHVSGKIGTFEGWTFCDDPDFNEIIIKLASKAIANGFEQGCLHPYFRWQGKDVCVEVPLNLDEEEGLTPHFTISLGEMVDHCLTWDLSSYADRDAALNIADEMEAQVKRIRIAARDAVLENASRGH